MTSYAGMPVAYLIGRGSKYSWTYLTLSSTYIYDETYGSFNLLNSFAVLVSDKHVRFERVYIFDFGNKK